MTLALLLLLQAAPDDAMARYREKTAVVPRCAAAGEPDEVTVCGRRAADR